MGEWEYKRLKAEKEWPRYKLTSPSLQALTPKVSHGTAKEEETWGLKVCPLPVLLPMPGGSQAEDGLAVVAQYLK